MLFSTVLCSTFFIKNLHKDEEGILIKSVDDEKFRELIHSMDDRGDQQNLYNLLTPWEKFRKIQHS